MHTIIAASATPAQPRAARRYGLILYFVTAYAWTWLFQMLSALMVRHTINLPLSGELVETIGLLGPALAALGVTAYESGGAGLRALLGQLLRWRVRPIWYAVALGGPLLLTLAIAVLYRATGGVLPASVPLPLPLPLLLLLFFVYVGLFHGGLDEELGWRGYALPRLQQRYGALTASLILGVIWAGWHLPAWLLPDSTQAGLSFSVFLVSVVATSIIFTWLYDSTGGSLLLIIVLHTVFDICTTGPWAAALLAMHAAGHGIDPLLIIMVLEVMLALSVVLLTNPRTLTGKRGGT
jgi:membrane protease YdiL (CAAX protease family)